MGSKKTHEQYVEELNSINPNIEIIGEYVNYKTKILHKCRICKYEWLASPASILHNGGCPKCSKVAKKTHEEYVKLLEQINPNIEVIE